MGQNKKHRTRDAEDFLRYAANEMSGEERNIFEKDLQKNAFDAEAMEGLSSIPSDEARKDLADLNQRLSGRTQHKNRFIIYRIAAAVAAIIVFGTLIIMVTRIGLFPGQVAVTETVKQKSEEPIQSEEIPRQPGSETPIVEKEASRMDIQTDIQPESQITTKIRETETIPALPEIIKPSEIKETVSKSELVVIADEKKPDIKDELREIIRTEELTEMVSMDETAEVTFREESAPTLSSRKARLAGEGNMVTGKFSRNFIRGTVVSSEDNLPLPGAVVTVKGTSAGTVTNHDGNFEITLQDDTNHTLVAEFIGMNKKEIELSDEEDVLITLEPSESTLEEVVVIGYGAQEKADLTGAVSTIKINDHTNYQAASPVTGFRKFKEYIENNLHYPEEHTTNTREVVVLSFMISKDGHPKDIFVLKSPGKKFSEEAIRLLKNGPDWFPAKRDGIEVEEEIMIRIVFKPDY